MSKAAVAAVPLLDHGGDEDLAEVGVAVEAGAGAEVAAAVEAGHGGAPSPEVSSPELPGPSEVISNVR